jgi:hypothetical protein
VLLTASVAFADVALAAPPAVISLLLLLLLLLAAAALSGDVQLA